MGERVKTFIMWRGKSGTLFKFEILSEDNIYNLQYNFCLVFT